MSSDNPALNEAPKDVSLGSLRERLSVAFAVHGADLPEGERIKLAEALAAPSPINAAVAAFDVLAANHATLGAVMLSRAIEAADLVAAHSWCDKGDDAAAFAASARAQLAALQAEPA